MWVRAWEGAQQSKSQAAVAPTSVGDTKSEGIKDEGEVGETKCEVIKDEGELDKAEGEVGEMKGEVDKAEGEAFTKGEVDKAEGEVGETKGEVDKAEGKVGEAKGEVDKAEGDVRSEHPLEDIEVVRDLLRRLELLEESHLETRSQVEAQRMAMATNAALSEGHYMRLRASEPRSEDEAVELTGSFSGAAEIEPPASAVGSGMEPSSSVMGSGMVGETSTRADMLVASLGHTVYKALCASVVHPSRQCEHIRQLRGVTQIEVVDMRLLTVCPDCARREGLNLQT